MEKHSCKTYFCVAFDFDRAENVRLLKGRRDCSPEEIGITNRADVERYITEHLCETPEWKRHGFVIGLCEEYDVDVNVMLRRTLANLLGKEDAIRRMQNEFSVTTTLEIVPQIAAESDEPKQLLSLERDIVKFLYASDTAMDLDYYVI